MSKNCSILGAGVGALAMAIAGAALAAPNGGTCLNNVTPDVVNNDDCTQAGSPGYVDPNGGCNFTGSPLQGLGALGVPSTTIIAGTVGTFIPDGATSYTSRDLDWYTFTLNAGAVVTFTVNMNNSFNKGPVPGFDNSVLFLVNGDTCPAGTTIYGAAANACSHSFGPLTLPAGSYTFIVTTPFEVDATVPFYDCPAPYEAVISVVPTQFGAVCAAATEGCAEIHAAPGCNDFACCEAVCAFNDTCCFVTWDQACVDLAVSECGYFIYNCPPGGTPPNDCATSPTLVNWGDTVLVSNVGATTDGPNGPSSFCPVDIGDDVWYIAKAPVDGELTVEGCNLSFDSAIAVYDVGTSINFDPALLSSVPSACADDTCNIVAGPTQITIINAIGDHYYAIRIGGWTDPGNPPQQGSGNVTFSFNSVIFTTGPQRFVTQISNGTNVNLGLSAGNVAVGFEKRWGAVPFTAPATPPGSNKWKVTKIVGKGFIPAGNGYYPGTIQNIGWVIWKRDPGNPAPTVQVASGLVPTPVNYDDADDDAANGSWPLIIANGPELEPGNYYLTLYGDNGGLNAPANWAWFITAQSGIYLTEGGLHGWRSTTIPSAFAFYTGLTGVYNVQAGQDPNSLYTNAFNVLGTPLQTGPVCVPGPDRNGDGCVNGADLAAVIGNWTVGGLNPYNPFGDANCDGAVNGADLAIVTGNWQPVCP